MKLTIERLAQPSAAEMADLLKIWPQQSATQLQQRLANAEILLVARFNDHLLAGLWVTHDGHRGQIQQLQVRPVTRRRGVGRYLLEQTPLLVPEISVWEMDVRTAESPTELTAFLHDCGWQARDANSWCPMTA
ncbi:aspartate 1-decarboxylase autocleavage activator PanM [Plesiomonas shigelloides]|uniref:aspartate 1-decarboxylase autocleavage activator PanM n=1 Tax=Plesiomonas shigelloides TaxID=703 RepID=UPI00387F30F9